LGKSRVLVPLQCQIDRERPRRALPDRRDFRDNIGRIVPGGALHAEPTGLADRTDEVYGDIAAHRRLCDRAVDTECPRE
jgi:hypothetical protein